MEECPNLDETVLRAAQAVVDRIFAQGLSESLVHIEIDHYLLAHPYYISLSNPQKLNALMIVKKLGELYLGFFSSGLRITVRGLA